jgi:3-hydroxyisobutyrate dehydrogenase
MASSLLAAGHDLVVFNRTAGRSDALVTRGARAAGSPREAAEGADAVVVMVSDDEASRAVWLGEDGVLAAPPADGAVAIECSTLSHGWVLELAEAVRRTGRRYLDCPVTGLPDAAAEGRLTLLVGGDRADVETARPVLDGLATDVVHFGPVGAGTAYKLIVNLMGAVQIAALAEGLALAERAGLDLATVERAIVTSQAASPQVVRNCRRMVAGDHEDPVVFSGRLRRKDVRYALGLADAAEVDVPFGRTALARLDALLEAGLGEQNESAVVEVARNRPARR